MPRKPKSKHRPSEVVMAEIKIASDLFIMAVKRTPSPPYVIAAAGALLGHTLALFPAEKRDRALEWITKLAKASAGFIAADKGPRWVNELRGEKPKRRSKR